MKHLDEGALLALADGELNEAEVTGAEAHLAECAACREELAQLREASHLLSRALVESDPPAPVASETTARSLRRRAVGRRAGRGWSDLRRAAVLVLGVAAAASATIPGSLVNRWLREMAEPEPARVAERERAVVGPAAAPVVVAEPMDETGVSVLPEGGSVQVVLRGASPELRVKAVLVEQPRAGVFAAGAATDARFSTAPGRIEVAGASGGELRIELPHAARVATVEVNGRRYISKEGDQLRLTVPAADSAGAEVTFRVLQ